MQGGYKQYRKHICNYLCVAVGDVVEEDNLDRIKLVRWVILLNYFQFFTKRF